jgi:outer membrane protein assembly factor BamE (lipoprotein component of BamABCDE complex)
MVANLRHFPAALTLLALAACTTANPVDQRGNLPEADKLAQIKPGTTDEATVTQLLGSPSSIDVFDANVWLYISQKTRPVALREPVLLDQQVVQISFNSKGIVQSVSHRSMADGEKIIPNPAATPAPGREFTFLEQLIGNFGRFSAGKSSNPGGGTPGGGGDSGGGP